MAVPKDKLSAAFQQKCVAAGDKLRKFQADKLKSDIERLYNESIHADLSIDVMGQTLSLHTLMIKARSMDLYRNLMSLSKRGNSVTSTRSSQATDIQHSLKSLYTMDDVGPVLKALSNSLNTNIQGTNDPTVVLDISAENLPLNGTSGRYSPECENGHCRARLPVDVLIDGETENPIPTGVHITDPLIECAQDLVLQVIENAKAILEAERNNSDIIKNDHPSDRSSESGDPECVDEEAVNKDDVMRNTTGCGQVENGVLAGDSECIESDSNGGAGTEDSDGNEAILKAARDDNNVSRDGVWAGDGDSNGVLLKATRDGSAGCIQGLISTVYRFGMKMEPCCGLGEDLLRMLLEQTDCDCVIKVDGKSFLAHRCILAARSWYFEAMLSGSWRESDQEEIMLEGIDGVTVCQMLLYLYGGVIEVDASCGLGSLIMVADMYSMTGLKDIVAFNLNMEYCHFFHRPCPGCTAGVPEALALTMMYNLDSLKDKCVKWINKNFGKVWPTKTFAILPQEVLEFCTATAVRDLALNNVVETMVECRKLNEKMPRLKWTEPIFDMITQLMDAAIEFSSQNFISLVASNAFKKTYTQGIAFNRQLLEEIFVMIIQALTPGSSCQAYLALNKWIVEFKAPEDQTEWESLYAQDFRDFVGYLFSKCKEQLCLYIHQAANTEQWSLLTRDMQREIMEEANYVCLDSNKARMARPKLTSMQKKITSTSPLSLKEYFECHFGSRVTTRPLQKERSKTSPATQQLLGSTTTKKKQDQSKGFMGTKSKTGPKSQSRQQPIVQNKKQGVKQKNMITSSNEKKIESASVKITSNERKAVKCERGNNDREGDSHRQRCYSAGASSFQPRFGMYAPLHSSQSLDSFLEPRPGHTSVLQPLIPMLEVKFIIPHEFNETF